MLNKIKYQNAYINVEKKETMSDNGTFETNERKYVLHSNNNNKYINNTVVGFIEKLIVGAASSYVLIDVV